MKVIGAAFSEHSAGQPSIRSTSRHPEPRPTLFEAEFYSMQLDHTVADHAQNGIDGLPLGQERV